MYQSRDAKRPLVTAVCTWRLLRSVPLLASTQANENENEHKIEIDIHIDITAFPTALLSLHTKGTKPTYNTHVFHYSTVYAATSMHVIWERASCRKRMNGRTRIPSVSSIV